MKMLFASDSFKGSLTAVEICDLLQEAAADIFPVENVDDQKEAMGIILHADAMDDAQKLRQMLVEKLPEMDIRIYPVGPVIGTHAGPGTIAFCFLGKKREI